MKMMALFVFLMACGNFAAAAEPCAQSQATSWYIVDGSGPTLEQAHDNADHLATAKLEQIAKDCEAKGLAFSRCGSGFFTENNEPTFVVRAMVTYSCDAIAQP